MEFEIKDHDVHHEVFLRGHLTFEGNENFRHIVKKFEHSSHREIIIDINELKFMDSAGLGMLLLLGDCAKSKGGKMKLRKPKGQVERLLTSCQFDRLLSVEY